MASKRRQNLIHWYILISYLNSWILLANCNDPESDEIDNILKITNMELIYPRLSRTVILMGIHSSGKTALSLLLSNKADHLTSSISDGGNGFILKDEKDLIDTPTNFPTSHLNDRNVSFHDWPRFGDEDAEIEIARASRSNQALHRIGSFKILLVLRQCYANGCGMDEKVGLAFESLHMLAKLLTHFDWYRDSVGLVYNKVANPDGSPASDPAEFIPQLEELLAAVNQNVQTKVAGTTDHNEILILQRMLSFITLLSRPEKSTIFLTPSSTSDNAAEDANIITSIGGTFALLKSLHFSSKWEAPILYPISAKTETEIDVLKNYTLGKVEAFKEKAFQYIVSEIGKLEIQHWSIQDRYDYFARTNSILGGSARAYKEAKTHEDFLLWLENTAEGMEASLPVSVTTGVRKMVHFAHFLADLTGTQLVEAILTWQPLYNNLAAYLGSRLQYRAFLLDLNKQLSSENFQKKRELYKVSDLAKSWGKGPEGQGLSVSRENADTFFTKITEILPSLARHVIVRESPPTDLQLENINAILSDTIDSEVTTTCKDGIAITTGNYIFLNDETFLTYSNCSDLKEILIFGLTKVEIGDKGIFVEQAKLTIITPTLEVRKVEIIQKGLQGKIHMNMETRQIDWGNCDNSLLEKGKPGLMGYPGEQPGEIFIITKQVTGSGVMAIKSFGGVGSWGQDGEKLTATARISYDAINQCDKKCEDPGNKGPECLPVCSIHSEVSLGKCAEACASALDENWDISQAGRGGYGNFPGKIILLLPSETALIRTLQVHGNNGRGGNGQAIGFSYFYNGIEETLPVKCSGELPCFTPNCRGLNANSSLRDEEKAGQRVSTNLTFDVTKFKAESIKMATSANANELRKLWDFFLSPKVAKFYELTGLVFETKTILPLGSTANEDEAQRKFFQESLGNQAKGILGFISNPNYKRTIQACARDPIKARPDEFCKQCAGLPCITVFEDVRNQIDLPGVKAAAFLLAAIQSQVVTGKGHADNRMVEDLTAYITDAESQVTDYKTNRDTVGADAAMETAAINMRTQNNLYKESILETISKTAALISENVQPEVDKFRDEIETKIIEIITKITEEEKESEEQFQNDRKLVQDLTNSHTFLSAGNIAFRIGSVFAKIGAITGSNIKANAGTALSITDHLLGTPPIERVNQVGEETKESYSQIKEFLQNHRQQKLGAVDKVFEEAKGVLDPATEEDFEYLKKHFTDNTASYNSQRTSSNPDFAQMRLIREEIALEFQRISGGCGVFTDTTSNAPGQNVESVKSKIQTFCFRLKMIEISEGLLGKLSDSALKVWEAGYALKALSEKTQFYRNLEDSATSAYKSMASDILAFSSKHESGGLGANSLAAINVDRWDVKNKFSDLREQVQGYGNSIGKFGHGVASTSSKIADILSALTNNYLHLEVYNEDRELEDFLYLLFISAKTIQVDPTLQEWITEVVSVAEENIVLWFYGKAVNAFYQYSFPMASIYAEDFPIKNVGGIENTISHAQEGFAKLKEKQIHEKGVHSGQGDQFRKTGTFDGNGNQPFSVFKGEEYSDGIRALFEQQPSTFFADVLHFNQSFDAVKVYAPDIQFKVRDEEPDWEARNTELQQALEHYSVQLTHTGNNYYRFNQNYFTMKSPVYTLAFHLKKEGGKVTEKNEIYKSLEEGSITLSPFTSWVVQLTKLNDVPEADLSKFKDLKIDMMLGGEGTFIDHDTIKNEQRFSMKSYYKVDESLGKIAGGSFREKQE